MVLALKKSAQATENFVEWEIDHGHRGTPTKIRFEVRQITRRTVSRIETLTHSAFPVNHKRYAQDFATYYPHL
jgi:hypothetical protein